MYRPTPWSQSAALFAALVLLVVCIGQGSSSQHVYRYRSLLPNAMRFEAKQPVEVTFVGLSSYVTDAADRNTSVRLLDSDCAFLDDGNATSRTRDISNNTVFSLECGRVGPKKIEFRSELDTDSSNVLVDTTYLYMSPSFACYKWYAIASNNAGFEHRPSKGLLVYNLQSEHLPQYSHLYFRVWVIDYERGSNQELRGSAVEPSELSRSLTGQFVALGDAPTMTISGGPPGYVHEMVIPQPWTYQESEGTFWSARGRTTKAELALLRITGQGATVLQCGVFETLVELSIAQFDRLTFDDSKELATSLANKQRFPLLKDTEAVQVLRNPCVENMALVLLPGFSGFLLSQTNLRSIELISLADDISGTLLSATFTPEGLLLLTSKNDLFIFRSNTTVQSNAITRVLLEDASQVDRITGPEVCDITRTKDCAPSQSNALAYAWEEADTGSYFRSTNSGMSFTRIVIPRKGLPGGLSLEGGRILGIYGAILDQDDVILVGLKSGGLIFLFNDVSDTEWRTGSLFAEGFQGNTVIVKVSPTGSSELLVYADELYYSINAGSLVDEMRFVSRDPSAVNVTTPEKLGYKERLVTIAVGSSSGVIAVLSNWGRLFFGSLGHSSLFELASGTVVKPASAHSISIVNTLTSPVIEIASFTTAAPYMETFRIPVQNEMRGNQMTDAFEQELKCPYVSVIVNDVKDVYYLDIGEEVTLAVTVVSSTDFSASSVAEIKENTFEGMVSNSQLLAIASEHSAVPMYGEGVLEQRSVYMLSGSTLVEYDDRKSLVESVGSGHFVLASSGRSVMCPVSQIQRRVRVGCAPGRHIRVRLTNEWACAESFADPAAISQAISKLEYCSNVPSPLVRAKSYSQDQIDEYWPCAMRVYHQIEGFRPIVDLYDGDTFVTEVHANYVVREVTGRTDFGYNATLGNVRCTRAPVLWDDIDSNTTAYTPDVYKSCFSDDRDDSMDAGAQYPIMNSSGISYIVFPVSGVGGMFYYELTVVDPEYSYCELSATFALNVHGAPLSRAWILIIVSIVTAVFILGLIVTYFFRFRQLKALSKKID